MRKLLIVLIVILIAAAGGGYVYWQQQAKDAEQKVAGVINRMNSGGQWISYESLSTSGFPMNVTVRVNKPVITVPTGMLMNFLTASQRGKPGAPELTIPADWKDTVYFGDAIVIRMPLGKDETVIITEGASRTESVMNGQTTTISQKPEANSTCTVAFSAGGRKAVGDQLAAGAPQALGQTFATYFRSLDCDYGASAWVDEATSEVLSRFDGATLDVSYTPSQGRVQWQTAMRVEGSEFTKAGDAWIQRYIATIDPKGELGLDMPFAALGKQRVAMDFSMDAPMPLQTASKTTPIMVNLKEFSYKSDLYDFGVSFLLDHKPDASGALNSASTFDYRSTVTPEYMTYLAESMERKFKASLEANPATSPATKALLERYTAEELSRKIFAIIPRFDQLGTVAAGWDGTVKGDAKLTDATLDLKRLEIGCTPYGLSAVGNVARTPQSPIPTTNITLTCRQCEPMIRDVTGWMERVSAFLMEVAPEKAAQFAVPPGMAEGLVRFVTSIGAPAETGNYVFELKSTPDGNMSINNKPAMEVMAAFQQAVMPQAAPMEAPQ